MLAIWPSPTCSLEHCPLLKGDPGCNSQSDTVASHSPSSCGQAHQTSSCPGRTGSYHTPSWSSRRSACTALACAAVPRWKRPACGAAEPGAWRTGPDGGGRHPAGEGWGSGTTMAVVEGEKNKGLQCAAQQRMTGRLIPKSHFIAPSLTRLGHLTMGSPV